MQPVFSLFQFMNFTFQHDFFCSKKKWITTSEITIERYVTRCSFLHSVPVNKPSWSQKCYTFLLHAVWQRVMISAIQVLWRADEIFLFIEQVANIVDTSLFKYLIKQITSPADSIKCNQPANTCNKYNAHEVPFVQNICIILRYAWFIVLSSVFLHLGPPGGNMS